MAKNYILYLLVILPLINISTENWQYYPEDISSIDYLTNPENENEIHLLSFYPNNGGTFLDKKNGINIYPIKIENLFKTDCGIAEISSSISFLQDNSNNGDNEWSISNMNSDIFPPRELLNKNFFLSSSSIIHINPKYYFSSSTSINNRKFSSELYENENIIFNYYLWITPIDNINNLFLGCKNDDNCMMSLSHFDLGNFLQSKTYQISFKFQNNKFIYNSNNFLCPPKSNGNIELILSNNNIRIHQIKITYEILSNIECSNDDNCPPSTRCINQICEKCDGRYSICNNIRINDNGEYKYYDSSSKLECSRFTKEWEDPSRENSLIDKTQIKCNADYYNINKLNLISFQMNPIKTGVATVSFWFYSIKPLSNNGIIHIILSDYMICTITSDSNKYNVYVTGYQLYHKAYGNPISEIKTKLDFESVISSFPYNKWNVYGNFNKFDRWINIRFSFNIHKNNEDLSKLTLLIQYYKFSLDSSSNINDIQTQFKNTINNEFLYVIDDTQFYESDIHFKKFYRTQDKTFLTIKNYGLENQLYIKNLYVYATDYAKNNNNPLDNSLYSKIKGLQYYAFESIFSNNKYFPELYFACPFDSISFDSSTKTYSIPYYIYDHYDNFGKKSKETLINSENIDNSLYSYYSKLYRINLINNKNYIFSNNDLSTELLITGPDFYFDTNKKYSCFTSTLPYLDLNDFECKDRCDNLFNVGKGINWPNNERGVCSYLCDSYNCNNNLPNSNVCNTGNFLLFDICLNDGDYYKISKDIGALYYSFFFNVPQITIDLKETYYSYYLKFNFRYETNKYLRPGIEHKGHKIYIFYTNSFKIWHDFNFNYIGIEDINGNDGKNLLPYFNLYNKNTFTIKVKQVTKNSITTYHGTIYLNNNINHSVDFNGGTLSHIYFCHNDTDCTLSDHKNIFWSSGYYDNIKIYNSDDNYVNDDVIYNIHIYDDIYLYISETNPYALLDQTFISSLDIPLTFGNINYNNFKSYKYELNSVSDTIDNFIGHSTTEIIQGYNYNDKQDIYFRDESVKKYIKSDGSIDDCQNENVCYGSGNDFSNECTICDENNYYFQFSNCINYPTSYKGFYVLPFPFILNNPSLNQITIDISGYVKNDRFTFSFWLKLLGFPVYGDSIRKIIKFKNLSIFFMIDDKKLQFIHHESYLITLADYPLNYYGKYIPISITYFSYCNMKSFFAIKVNNIDYSSSIRSNIIMDVSEVTLYSKTFYGTIANLNYYNQAIIGTYAFETNTQYKIRSYNLESIEPTIKIINGNNKNCINLGYICIIDYDIALNQDYYLQSKGYPNEKKVFKTENNGYSYEDCSEKCGSFCYNNEDDSSCSCTNEGINDYLVFENDKVKCRKLPYYNIQRIKKAKITGLVPSNTGGFSFWFYVSYDSDFSTCISYQPKIFIQFSSSTSYNIYIGYYRFKVFENEFRIARNIWYNLRFDVISKKGFICRENSEVCAEFDSEISNFPIDTYLLFQSNYDFSTGFIFIRQFQIWNDYSQMNKAYKLNIKNTINRQGLYAVIDTIINKEEKLIISSQYEVQLSDFTYIDTEEGHFGYYPRNDIVFQELKLNNEYERDSSNIRFNGLDDFLIDKIPPSITNSYTIEMWVKVINPKNFINGMNIIWEKHISISIINNKNTNSLSYICFPQDYLTSPKDKSGREIFNLIPDAFNIDYFEVDEIEYDNVWIHIRCAFSWINELYYQTIYSQNDINIYSAFEKNVIKENTYSGQKVDYPFKYFFYENDGTNLIFQNAKLNPSDTTITMRALYLYNDYLKPDFETQRVIFTSSAYISPLIFHMEMFYENFDIGNDIGYYINNQKFTINPNNINENRIKEILIKGTIILCKAQKINNVNNAKIYNKDFVKCANLEPTQKTEMINSNAKIIYGTKILECNTGYYLSDNICYLNKCPNTNYNRPPFKSSTYGYCSYKVDEYHSLINSPLNYRTNLKCIDGYTNVGYKCLNTQKQIKSALYFNHCYNFLPAYQKFTSHQLEKTENGYVIEFWFKFDKVNEFCGNNKDRYVLWIYPHSLIQYANSDIVYYKDLFLSNLDSSYSPIKLNNIHLYEWNFVMIEYRKDKGYVKIWINYKTNEPDYSYNIENAFLETDKYNVKAFAFCNGKHYCAPLEQIEISWTSAYYSKMRIYDISSSSIYMVMENSLGKVISQPKNVMVYYLFNTVNNEFNIIYDKNYPLITSKSFNLNDNLITISDYRVDDVMLLYSSTSNFDWGEENRGKYIISQEVISGEIKSGLCVRNCKRCYSDSSNDCYECIEGYTLYYSECRQRSGYYPQIPLNIDTHIVPNIDKNGFKIDNYNPLTITIWIKFFGVKYNNIVTDINTNCVLIIQISIQNKVYLCYNTQLNNIQVYYNDDTILFYDSLFLLESGKWVLLSFSNYNSNHNDVDTTNYYPLMFSFSFNSYTVPRADTFQISEPGIIIDKIIFGGGISASFTDLRIYHSFILNPYGIITNNESYQKLLIYNLKLYNQDISCIPIFDLYDLNGNELHSQITCISDYNIYHDINNINCNENKYKRVNYDSLENECVDCIDECYYCGGETQLNCACYYNDIYWFRNEENENRLYCQKIPYHDFNIYSDLQFTDISYATTNEYSIEFWYFIYEYVNENKIFQNQLIQWNDHNTIIISKKDDINVNVDCYPIHNHDNNIKVTDSSHEYYKWNHVICSTNLKKKLYYLNDLSIKSFDNSQINNIDYSYYGNAKTKLIFQNNPSQASHGLFFIRELKLWSLYSMREFPTNCVYNIDFIKNKDINFLLHYFPFTYPENGVIYDSKGNEPKIKVIKSDIIGYNIIDYKNEYSLFLNFDECLIVYSIPSVGYFNMTYFYIKTYLETPLNDDNSLNPSYTFSFYISEDGKKKYSEITTGELGTEEYSEVLINEVLIAKLTDTKFNNSNINVYVTETDPITGIIKYGFSRIQIIDYSNLEINLEKYLTGFEDDIEVDSSDLSSKVILSDTQIWIRLKTLSSLADIPIYSLTAINMTDTELTYNKLDNTNLENYIPNGITINNPICSQDFCSYKGDCYIVVRGMECECYDDFVGSNCHLYNINKDYIQKLYIKFWNYLTNNNDITTMSSSDFTNEFISKLLYLVKTSTTFTEMNSEIIHNFYTIFDFLYINYDNLFTENYMEFLLAFDYLIINLYKEINSYRLNNYVTNSTSTTNNSLEEEDIILSEITSRRILNENNENENMENPELDIDYEQRVIFNYSLTKNQIKKVYDYSIKIIEYIKKIISKEIFNFKENLYLTFQSYDLTIISVTEEFNYTQFFNNKLIENQNNKFYYKSYIDASNCSSHIFKHTSYSNLFLIIIQYRYNPLSFHSTFPYSSSFLNDILFMDENGNSISLTDCSNNYKIYFPLNLYNKTKTKLILTHGNFIFKNPNIGTNHPYVTWPVYVFDNGTVYNKSRELRIEEVYKLMNFYSTYYDYDLKINKRYDNINYDNYFISCSVNHLGLFSLEVYNNNEKYKIANLFFYLEAYRVFKNYDNFLITPVYIYVSLFAIFIFGLILISLIDYFKSQRKKDLLNGIKEAIIRENTFYSSKNIDNEINRINKLYNQEQLINDLGMREKMGEGNKTNFPNKQYEKNNEKAFKNRLNSENETLAEKDTQIEKTSRYKGNPPRKYIEESSSENNDDKESDEDNSNEDNYNEDISIEDVDMNNIYQVKNYKAESYSSKDKKEPSFGFISEYSDSEEKKKRKKKQRKKKEQKEQYSESESYNITNLNRYNKKENLNKPKNFFNNNYENDTQNKDNNARDYLTKQNFVNVNNDYKNNNQIHFVKYYDTRIKIFDIFEDIEDNNISTSKFLKWTLINRNIYTSVFTIKSLLNPKWKRYFVLYIYVLLQYLFSVFYLTLFERINWSKLIKILLIHIFVLMSSNLVMYGIIWFFRVDIYTKIILLHILRSSEQMKLIL